MSNDIPVITFDGPAGSGKGTIGRAVAKRLGWHFLESGALYRLLAYAALQAHVSQEDEAELVRLASDLDIQFTTHAQGEAMIYLAGKEVTRAIHTEDCGHVASFIAAHAKVRDALLTRQRAFRRSPGLIADGRDMGTIVFPDAVLKFYLDARLEARAERRYNQLKQQGIDANLRDILNDLEKRDRRDKQRVVAPLKPAEDAHIIDTTSLCIHDVEHTVWEIIEGLLK